MVIVMIILAASLAVATFIENDYGTRAARGMIYNSHWLEMVFFLLAVNLTGQIFTRRLYRREKITVLFFHLAFIIMIAGAAISRYTGFEGTISIREGEASSSVHGFRDVTLPFALRLDDFVIERYPGSNSPSGFRSIVTVLENKPTDGFQFEIYMNHILKYKGYRFFQSSFDKDERGTVLSVNHDPWGMAVTYTGYAFLFLFIILSIINKRSFFATVTPGYWSSKLRRAALVFVTLLISSHILQAQQKELIPDRTAAERFGTVLVQDQKGRTKPLYTLSSDVLRKVSKQNRFNGLTAMQVFMGYSLDFENWQRVPLIKVADKQLQKVLSLKGGYASFSDIVTLGEVNTYKLAPYIEKAYSRPAAARTHFDKEVIKVDERLNICYMVGQGDFLRLFPISDSTGYWGTAAEAAGRVTNPDDSVFISSLLPGWAKYASGKIRSTGENNADLYTAALLFYQKEFSSYTLPSAFKVKCEVLYNKAGIFEKLFPCYAAAGILLLVVLIARLISGTGRMSLGVPALAVIIGTAFLFHTLGLVLRWYISGHSPMSNGYESMLFISWVTMVAGFIFGRRSMLTLAATTVLAGMTLMVAHMSFMDPEITNLVPVLKSYWLTLHVSVITGSYAFLGLGALLGLINLIMIIPVNERNRERIALTVDQLTTINYRSLTIGLYLLTIGTFLGAIWANESWGRYWGWDPKETWSLITIIVYALVIHSHLIPGGKDVYLFNLFALFTFSSVLMTYFGVNYYLSGMHSYAGNEPAHLPGFIYITVFLIVGVAVAAFVRYRGKTHNVLTDQAEKLGKN